MPLARACAIWGNSKSQWRTFDKVLNALKPHHQVSIWHGPVHEDENQRNLFQSWVDGYNVYMGELTALPLPFWMNFGYCHTQIMGSVLVAEGAAEFFTKFNGVKKEIAREIMLEAKIEEGLVNAVLGNEGDTSSAIFPGLDYSDLLIGNVISKFEDYSGLSAAISGKHTKSGKPMIASTRDGHTWLPGDYYLSGMHW